MRSMIPSPATILITLVATLSAAPVTADSHIVIDTGPNWVSLGPEPIEESAAVGSGGILSPPVSGRASVLAVNPFNRYNVWLGTAGGGVWVTNNEHIGGLPAASIKSDEFDFDRTWLPQWFPHNDGFPSLSIGAIVLDPDDCTETGCFTAYVGTGENSLRRDTYYGDGLYRVHLSTSGEFDTWSWQRLDTASQFRYGTTAALVLDDDELLIALSAGNTTTSAYASVRAPEPAAGYGVHRRTAGGSWSQIFETPSTGLEAWADQLLPTDLEKIPGSAHGFLLGVHNDGVFRTNDRGMTWCALNPGARMVTASTNGTVSTAIIPCTGVTGLPMAGTFDHVEIAVESDQVFYALFGNCPSGFTDAGQGATSLCSSGGAGDRSPFLYKSSDGGLTWNEPGPLTGAHYSRYTHALVPTGGGGLLWGGLLPWFVETASGLTQSNIRNGTLHYDVHDFDFFPNWDAGSTVVYAATDGGFYYRVPNQWFPGNDSLITTAFCNIAIDYEDEPGDGIGRTTALLGGLQDNSNAAWNGSPVWQMWGPVGDGGEAFIETPTVTYDSVQDNVIRRIPGFSGFSTSVGGPVVNQGEDVSFYAPYTQHEESKRIFVATDVISVREGQPSAWDEGSPFPAPTQISPVLGTDGHAFHPIETDRDLITAITVAPSHGWRVYAGLYSGKLWRSKTAPGVQPQPTMADWERVDTGLPNAPISSIVVHPTDHRTLWVTFSGFIDQQVWFSSTGGSSWEPRSSGIPSREPAKVVKVVTNAPNELWLGTDTGVYRSEDSGMTWQARKGNLPPAAVFDLEIDHHNRRVFAATHGRGVWMLSDTGPLITTFEGWTEDGIWDIPIYGTNFRCAGPADCACTVDVEREDGIVCATGSEDARGNAIFVRPGDHVLRSEDQTSCTACDGKPVVFACFNGNCVGGTPLADCNQGGHRVSAVRVRCDGNPAASGSVAGFCPEQANPPSSVFEVTPTLTIPGSESGGGGAEAAPAGPSGPQPIVLTPTVLASSANGGDRVLCTALADLGHETPSPSLAMRDAINDSPGCQAAGVSASLIETTLVPREDRLGEPDRRVALSASSVTGTQMVLAVQAGPGVATEHCFEASRLGVYLANQLAITQMRFPTAPGGAAGGEIEIREISPVGRCVQRVTTTPGQSSAQIASAVVDAFLAPGATPTGTCPEAQNPRDVVLEGDRVVTVLPTRLVACIRDPGIGFSLGPHGLLTEFPQIQVPGPLQLDDTCVGDTTVHTLDVCNTGQADLVVGEILSSDPAISVTTPSSGFPVAIGPDFCFPFQVAFSPTNDGPHGAILSVPSNDPIHPVTRVEATGTATVPDIAVQGASDFGVVSAWSPGRETVSVCNLGPCPLAIAAATIDCSDFTIDPNPFPETIAPGACRDLSIAFTPRTPGRKACTLTVTSDDPDTPAETWPLSARTPPWFGLSAGFRDPRGDLDSAAGDGSMLALHFLAPMAPRWGWDVRLGTSRLDGDAGRDDVDVHHLAASGRLVLTPNARAQLFLFAGPFVTHLDPGDFEGGLHAGLGVHLPAGPRFAFEARYAYYDALTASSDLVWQDLVVGFLVSF